MKLSLEIDKAALNTSSMTIYSHLVMAYHIKKEHHLAYLEETVL